MGYSVYLVVSEKHLNILKRVFEGESLQELLDLSQPVFSPDDIGYKSKRHEQSLCFGFNYGSDIETPHAVVATVASLIGRKIYWFDGEKTLKVSDVFWWRNPVKGRSFIKRMKIRWMKKDLERIDLICRIVEQRYDHFSRSYIQKEKDW